MGLWRYSALGIKGLLTTALDIHQLTCSRMLLLVFGLIVSRVKYPLKNIVDKSTKIIDFAIKPCPVELWGKLDCSFNQIYLVA